VNPNSPAGFGAVRVVDPEEIGRLRGQRNALITFAGVIGLFALAAQHLNKEAWVLHNEAYHSVADSPPDFSRGNVIMGNVFEGYDKVSMCGPPDPGERLFCGLTFIGERLHGPQTALDVLGQDYEFGARPTYSQATVEAAFSEACRVGGTLYLPAGTYLLPTAPIKISSCTSFSVIGVPGETILTNPIHFED